MSDRRPIADQIDSYVESLQAIITTHGWAVQGVFPTAAEPGIDWSYTVGLTEAGHPELIVLGFPQGFAQHVLNRFGAMITNGKHTFAAGEVVTDDSWTGELRVHGPVDARAGGYPVSLAERLYGDVGVLQVLWPDPAGRYADDPAGAEVGACSPILPLA